MPADLTSIKLTITFFHGNARTLKLKARLRIVSNTCLIWITVKSNGPQKKEEKWQNGFKSATVVIHNCDVLNPPVELNLFVSWEIH